MITIDVNSGRGSSKRDVEETAFFTNLEAAEAIARQLRLRDLGGLIVIDFIDMRDRKHNAEVETAFNKDLSLDRSRIQLSRISKFGIIQLSRQKKQSTIQEISYTTCPHCKGSGVRPSLEYIALAVYRKIKSEVVKADCSMIKVALPWEVSDYLLNQKRMELTSLENTYETVIHISGNPTMQLGDSKFERVRRPETPKIAEMESVELKEASEAEIPKESEQPEEVSHAVAAEATETGKKKTLRRRPRRRRRRVGEHHAEKPIETSASDDEEGEIKFFELTEPQASEFTSEPKEEQKDEEKKSILNKLYDIFST
jgi:ribonuclease E